LVDSISYYLRHPDELPKKNMDVDDSFNVSDDEIDNIVKEVFNENNDREGKK